MSSASPGATDTTAPTLVVGTDGSAWASAAVAWTATLAHALGARVVVVHAVPLLDRLPDGPKVISSEVRAEIEVLLAQEWTAPLQALDVRYHVVLEDGPPLLALPRVAEREQATMIVVATHGKGGRLSELLGSTSRGLVAAAGVPVVIVPRRWAEENAEENAAGHTGT